MLLVAGFVAALLWAKNRDLFERVEFSLKTASGGSVRGRAILPKPVVKHPVAVYLHGAGASVLGSGKELRQVAELGLATIGLEYDQTNQTAFDAQFLALHQYLLKQSWAQSNATAWVGYRLGAQRILSFALRNPELEPQLMVRRAGGWIPELDGNEAQAKPLTPSLSENTPLPAGSHPLPVRRGEGIRPSTPMNREQALNPQLSTFIHCPVLLVHGERDGIFSVADCKRLAERLRAEGTPVEVRILPEAGHGFGEDNGAVVRAVAEYCAAHLPLTDYAAAVTGCELTPGEAERFNAAMRRAGQHRRELWRAVNSVGRSSFTATALAGVVRLGRRNWRTAKRRRNPHCLDF